MLVDTHCHLDFPEFASDRDAVIRNSKDNGIGYIINIGSSLESSRDSVELAAKYDFIYASVGIHPHEADRFDKETENNIRDLATRKKVVAIGEIGLDFYRNYSAADNQRLLFKSLLKLAKERDLPAVIHMRQAQDETLRVLKNEMPLKAVIHCFSGDADFLKECLELGFYISYTCNVTYKKAQNLRDVLNLTPMDRLLLETDCPYLSCEGFRGKRNEPRFVKNLAEEVARIKNKAFEEIAESTTSNAIRFFKLK